MRNSLLWVYEGQTQYWGTMLAARAGLWTPQQALDVLAGDAATYDAVAGRAWKPLIDTTNDPITAARAPEPWRNWQRSEDYYTEGLLIWLDADTLIRERSGGKRSLDDFAARFFGVDDGSWTERSLYLRRRRRGAERGRAVRLGEVPQRPADRPRPRRAARRPRPRRLPPRLHRPDQRHGEGGRCGGEAGRPQLSRSA